MIINFLYNLGDNALYFVSYLGAMGVFLFHTFVSTFQPPFRPRHTLQQLYTVGASSLFVIFLTAGFIGMVLGLQGYYSLHKFGSDSALGSVVALTIIREVGPVFTAFMVISRAGSAMCAEIGVMRISEQIDALKVMSIDPYRFLISPKVIAGIISLPLLASFFNVVGIAGGYLVGVKLLGINPGAYLASIRGSVVSKDIMMGLYKSLAFGLIFSWICCFIGYNVGEGRRAAMGAKGVSIATTRAVVISSIAVLACDFLISSIMI